MYQEYSEYEKAEEYIPPLTLFDILLIIYIDCVLVIGMLPTFITGYFIDWQEDIKVVGESIKTQHPTFSIFFGLPMLIILILVCSNKHIISKVIGTWISFSFTQWVIAKNIPNSLIDLNIGPRLREQYYEIMKTLPTINLILCIILGVLIILFKKKKYFNPTDFKGNRIVIFTIMIMFVYVLPLIIIPITKPWKWLNFM